MIESTEITLLNLTGTALNWRGWEIHEHAYTMGKNFQIDLVNDLWGQQNLNRTLLLYIQILHKLYFREKIKQGSVKKQETKI